MTMNTGAYAGLRMAARAGRSDPETNPTEMAPDEDEDDTSAKDGKQKESTMTDTTTAAAAARAEGFADANARCTAVLASDHYAGRETLAQTLLGNDKLTADEIVTALASAPKIEASPLAAEAADGAALAAMQAALAETGNSSIDAGNTPASKADSPDVWGQAAKINNFSPATAG